MQSSPSLTGHDYDEPPTADLSGRCVGNSYILIAPVGQGATGTVWRGIERGSGGYVAVKLLHESLLRQPKLVTRFVRERMILTMMRHDNIVGVRDLFSVGESLALVMDFVAGGSLRDRLVAAGTLPPAEAAHLLAQVAAALAHAHELGVVHRDVKPDNILLQPDKDRDDGRPAVRLTDFGIARVLDTAGLTTPQAIMGTPHYMAPEAVRGEAGPASDVYAVGIVLYELVTGRPPYSGEPIAVLRHHLDDAPERPPDMPDDVWDVVRWCVDKDPERRPAADELGLALRDLARRTDGLPASPSPAEDTLPGVREKAHPSVRRAPARRPRNGPRSWMWRRPGLMIALIAALMAASGVGGVQAWRVLDTATAGRAAQAAPVRGALPDAKHSAPPAVSAAPGQTSPEPVLVAGDQTGATPPGPAGAAGTVSAGPAQVGISVGPGHASGSIAFGPWRCADEYGWDLGHPVLARPCHANGASIRVQGWMGAMPGVQADISLSVRDAATDEIVAGPYTCKGMMFDDISVEHACGPVNLQAPHGHRYLVAESWAYTGRSILPGGIARGPAFDW